MSVHVNLLPAEVRANERASMARLALAAGAVAFVAALGGLYVVQVGQVTDAEETLAAVEADNALLQARIGELAPFAGLSQSRDEAVTSVTTAMDREASFAGVLQDLSSVFPPNAEIADLSMFLAPTSTAPSAGGTRAVQGRLSATGRVLVGIAPGVERMLISVERAAGFDNAFVTASQVEEGDVVSYTLDVELGSEILTERYSLEPQEVLQ